MITLMPAGRLARVGVVVGVSLPIIIIWTFWYAMNSDRDNIPPVLTHLIPAGHATCQSSTEFQCSSCLDQVVAFVNETDPTSWSFDYTRDGENEGLREDQCKVAFPGLFEDVDLGTQHWAGLGGIHAGPLERIVLQDGMTRAMIHEGQLYVIATKSSGEDHRRKAVAILGAMYRALSAAPDRRELPNIEFVFSIEDKATDLAGSKDQPLWILARRVSEASMFLIPDFGLWAWDNIIGGKNNEIGPYDEVVEKAVALEDHLSFSEKEQQLVWRGKLSFAPKLRRALLDAARGAEWNNVKEINWDVRDNYLTLDEHCKYAFIAHVEGRSYSASLKYRQACRSVIVAHKLQYIQHHHYLLVSHGPNQNYVEVERDFSDLTAKMEDLLKHPKKAERIANNSVKTFRERYLTQAAEACYWRALWRGYGSVVDETSLYHNSITAGSQKRGLRYETFLLLSSEEMLNFHMNSG